jgi:hypothetical protein
MIQTGSMSYTRNVLSELKQSVLTEIAVLGGHSGLEQLIQMLDAQVDKCDVGDSTASPESAQIISTL